MVHVDAEKCKELGRELSRQSLNPVFYQRPFVKNSFSKDSRVKALLYAVAICHQTQNFVFQTKNLYGWEVIEEVFLKLLENEDWIFDTAQVLWVSEHKLEHHLLSVFSESGKETDSVFDRVEERSGLLRECIAWLDQRFHGSGEALLQSFGNNVLAWYKGLAHLGAFADPLRKKTSFLLKLMADSDLIRIDNPDDFIPIMDYHMQRVLLRTGAVEITDQKILNQLMQRRQVSVEVEKVIRQASIEAMRIISAHSGMDLPNMNDVFWPLGRSCCHESPLCIHKTCEKKPCTLTLTLHLNEHKSCIFEGVCAASGNHKRIKIWQPLVQTHFY